MPKIKLQKKPAKRMSSSSIPSAAQTTSTATAQQSSVAAVIVEQAEQQQAPVTVKLVRLQTKPPKTKASVQWKADVKDNEFKNTRMSKSTCVEIDFYSIQKTKQC